MFWHKQAICAQNLSNMDKFCKEEWKKNPKQCKFTVAVISEGVFFFKMKSQSNSSGSWIKYAGFCCGFCENMSVQQNMQDISRVAIISHFPPLWAAFDFLADYFCTRSTWAVYKKHLMFFVTGCLRTNTTKQEERGTSVSPSGGNIYCG